MYYCKALTWAIGVWGCCFFPRHLFLFFSCPPSSILGYFCLKKSFIVATSWAPCFVILIVTTTGFSFYIFKKLPLLFFTLSLPFFSLKFLPHFRSPKHTPQKTPKVKNPSQFITRISWQYWIFQPWTINQYWLAFQCNADMVKCRLCIELCPLLWITHLKWKNGNLQMILNPKETGWTRRVELEGLTT